MSANAGNIFEEKNIPTPTGKIETFYYDVDFNDMLKLLKQDHREGRSLGNKSKPSLLTPYFNRAENMSGMASNQFAGNAFASNAQLCLTIININVPRSTTIGGVTSSSSSRNCSTGIAPYARSNIGPVYQSYWLQAYYDQMIYKIGAVRDFGSAVPENEIWGLSIFDQAGAGGRIQEMVLVQTNYF